MTLPLSAVILAGGRSRRLGVDKRFLRLGSDRGLLENTIATVATISDDIVVVTNEPWLAEQRSVRVVGDERPGAGALGGLYSGLLAVSHSFAYALACDLPFLSVAALRYLDGFVDEDVDVIAPRRDDGTIETLHAIYSKHCLGPIKRHLEAGRLRIADVYQDLSVRWIDEAALRAIDPDLLSLFNINTPAELLQAKAIISGRS